MNPLAQEFAQVREALESFPGAPCSCPKHKFLLDADAALSVIERHTKCLESIQSALPGDGGES